MYSALAGWVGREAGVVFLVGCGIDGFLLHVFQLLWDDQPVIPYQSLARRSNSLLTVRCEGNIAGSCMFARHGPFGFAVSNDETSWCGHVRCFEVIVITIRLGCAILRFKVWSNK